jgi:hypothetical protein
MNKEETRARGKKKRRKPIIYTFKMSQFIKAETFSSFLYRYNSVRGRKAGRDVQAKVRSLQIPALV